MSEGLLRQVERWQRAIATYLTQQQPALSPSERNYPIQNLIINLLGLKLCEQYRLISAGHLHRLQRESDIYGRLQHLIQVVNTSYPSLLLPLNRHLIIPDDLLCDTLIQLETAWTTAIGVELLGQAYERCLSQWEITNSHGSTQNPSVQKTGGSYYTPRAIANDILHNTLDRLSNPRPTVLDPACGGGVFLLTAYQRLLEAHAAHLPYEKRRSLLLDCIFGVDIDPQAIAVTKLSLWLQLLIGESDPPGSLPNLDHNLQCGNALINFDWHQTFPVLTEAGGFDGVVGNPPYLDSEWMTALLPEWRRYCTTHYQTAVGNWDLFCVFIEKGLELCKPGGVLSFVVPNKLASATYAAKVRSLLTRDNHLLAIHDYSRVPVFAAAAYPLVFIAQKGIATSLSSVEYAQMTLVGDASAPVVERSHSFDYALYTRHPEQPWLLSSPNASALWLAELRLKFPPLAEIAQVTGAATVAEAYDLRSLLQDKPEPEPGDLRMVNSGTIDRYCLLWGQKPLRYLGASYWHPVVGRSQAQQLPQKRWQQASQPKIVVAGMTQGLECALDATGGILAGKSTSVVCSTVDLRYLLGILNSSLIRLYFVSHFGGNSLQGGYLRVGPPQLKQIPIPPPDLENVGDRPTEKITANHSLYCQLLELVNWRLLQGQSRESVELVELCDRQINHLVYELYGLTTTEIEQVEAWDGEARNKKR
ncbi:N-6 DNA methylase [Oscillatoria sp. FACHB-1407]|uniref:Eco57I restriction-modification methylase domain-containing protein n=1 Tax=Oscillatoria sp. FACHB-1407 TaxID=2692847 RepID=UPI00168A210D|nr:DNA methyltransferase [Oscillatoria sp. FACHB-1407]MBD2462652.1 N-6 DNA methylase [Oscillatoria sp. FACHB-1407]